MPVQLVIGRAGSGKSEYCRGQVVQSIRRDPLGPPILYILPRQATFEAERALTCLTGLAGFTRALVVSFEQFAHRVIENVGGGALPQVTSFGRRMILGYLLRQLQPQLQHFGRSAAFSGLATRLEGVFSELDRCDLSPHDALDRVNQSPDDSNLSLRRRLADLVLIHDRYQQFLGQDRLDPQRRLQRIVQGVRQWPALADAEVWIDGFLSFTRYERKLVVELARVCRKVGITVLADPARLPDGQPADLSGFHRSELNVFRLQQDLLKAGVEILPPVLLADTPRFTATALRHLERSFLSDVVAPAPAEGAVRFIEAADRRAEVAAAARHIRQAVLNPVDQRSALRYRDVAVLMRHVDEYAPLMDEAFREHEIPFFMDRRRPVGNHPLMLLVQAALQIVEEGWSPDALRSVIKSGLCGLTDEEADDLDDYLRRHRIVGRAAWVDAGDWAFRDGRRSGDDEDDDPADSPERLDLARINTFRRRLVNAILPFERAMLHGDGTVLAMVSALYRFLGDLGAHAALARWVEDERAAGNVETADEHLQLWRDFAELLEEMAEVLGEQPIALEDFRAALDAALESFDLAITPSTLDQVLVGSIDRSRTGSARLVILLGFDEASFPASAAEDPIFDDAQRRTLEDLGLELEAGSLRQTFDEHLFGYLAVTRASERLLVFRARGDARGREVAPSRFWRRIAQCISGIETESAPGEHDLQVAQLATPRQAVSRLLLWGRSGRAEAEQLPSFAALYDWMRRQQDSPVARVRALAWPALAYANAPVLDREVAGRLFPTPLYASASSLQTFARCPFQYFARAGLGLEDPREDDPIALDLGNLHHRALELLVRHMQQQGGDPADLDPAQLAPALDAAVQQAAQETREQIFLSSARARYQLKVARRDLGLYLLHHRAAARRNGFRPHALELAFGLPGSRRPALSIELGAAGELRLRGRIDRVDTHGDGVPLLIDYKLSGSRFKLEDLVDGVGIQLLVYLLVLDHALGRRADDQLPAGAVFWPLRRKIEAVNSLADLAEPESDKLVLQDQPRGLLVFDHFEHLGNTPEAAADVFSAKLTRDGAPYASSDLFAGVDVADILSYARDRIARLAVEIRAGGIAVKPWKRSTTSACALCTLQSVCRFSTVANTYRPGASGHRHLLPVIKEGCHG